MNEELIFEILEAISEDYSIDELTEPEIIYPEMEYFLGFGRAEALPIVLGAIELKLLRGCKPLWQILLGLN